MLVRAMIAYPLAAPIDIVGVATAQALAAIASPVVMTAHAVTSATTRIGRLAQDPFM